jgi:DNA-binding NarL/FixJ family response regulator
MPATVPAPRDAPAGPPTLAEAEPAVVEVLLASDQRLIAETVAAALRDRGFGTTVLDWHGRTGATLRRLWAPATAQVAVLLYDVDMSVRMATAASLMRAWPGPWLVLTAAPPGPLWGGLRSSGVAALRPREVGLAEVETLLRSLAGGRGDPAAGALDEYVVTWQTLQERHAQLQRRLDTLAPRQLQVLELLYQGVQVQEIARRLGLAESTVRSQVHTVLRKLGVRSQLAAVAMLHAIERSAADAAQSTGDRHST